MVLASFICLLFGILFWGLSEFIGCQIETDFQDKELKNDRA
jgi:hypothetical protein